MLIIWPKKSGFGLKSNGKVIFRNFVQKLWSTFRGTPLFPFGKERRKIPYHLNESSLSRTEGDETPHR